MARYKFAPANLRDLVGCPTPKGVRGGRAMKPGIVEIADFDGLAEAIKAINAGTAGIDGKPCLSKLRKSKGKD
ncbi:MAG: hypothetical protein COA38_20575 [Fluviicola sp.]|nr:MAG: hypothetical protein COA38_20575 [Fluviicola sp.]